MRWAFSPCGPTRLADHLTGNHLEQLDLDPPGGGVGGGCDGVF